jgi:hypothetical protein
VSGSRSGIEASTNGFFNRLVDSAIYFAYTEFACRRSSENRQERFKDHQFGGSIAPRDAVTLGATTPVWKEENAMKAMIRDAYGPPDVLELREIDIPEIADDEYGSACMRPVWVGTYGTS